ncbi:hypothetical protein PhCBS80983_g02499 [Powellomyces hirtus]|uniref:Alternative oxidase n=1 Tax=Powellomyces hirtus TaxID=109895 RepID=A0A507E5N4_9FUNG|nr:hypothetical protein PhCBS80983_g02499 [Powellomyces hirtus]
MAAQRFIRPSLRATHVGLLRPSLVNCTLRYAHVPSASTQPSSSPHPKLTPSVVTADGSNQTSSGPHPKLSPDANAEPFRATTIVAPAKKQYIPPRPIYTKDELNGITVTHREIEGLRDRIAYNLVQVMRYGFDTTTNYSEKIGTMSEQQWLTRILFLETVAGVPGMVAGVVRHLRSLRLLRRDNGWIHTLLDEAQNERMHLLSFLKVKQPSIPFRAMVLLGQGVFFNLFFAAYLLSPRTCHRFVGYLEESAVKTYSHTLEDIDGGGKISHWATTPCPDIAREYWQLGDKATLKDLVAAVRADEAEHRDVNHTLATLKPDDPNPF